MLYSFSSLFFSPFEYSLSAFKRAETIKSHHTETTIKQHLYVVMLTKRRSGEKHELIMKYASCFIHVQTSHHVALILPMMMHVLGGIKKRINEVNR